MLFFWPSNKFVFLWQWICLKMIPNTECLSTSCLEQFHSPLGLLKNVTPNCTNPNSFLFRHFTFTSVRISLSLSDDFSRPIFHSVNRLDFFSRSWLPQCVLALSLLRFDLSFSLGWPRGRSKLSSTWASHGVSLLFASISCLFFPAKLCLANVI